MGEALDSYIGAGTYHTAKPITVNGTPQEEDKWAGWYVKNSEISYTKLTENYSFETTASNITYTPGKKYSLSFDLDGGTGSTTGQYIDTEGLSYTSVPTKEHYTFTGWSQAGETTKQKPLTIPAGTTGNKAYTANWEPTKYNININKNGGTGGTDSRTYTYFDNNIALSNPTKTWYTFTGWTGSNGSTPQTSVSIPKNSSGNKSYTANWTISRTEPLYIHCWYNSEGGTAPSWSNPSNYIGFLTVIDPDGTEHKTYLPGENININCPMGGKIRIQIDSQYKIKYKEDVFDSSPVIFQSSGPVATFDILPTYRYIDTHDTGKIYCYMDYNNKLFVMCGSGQWGGYITSWQG